MSYIKVAVTVNRPVKDTWALWTDPMHLLKWNAASPDWQTSFADGELRTGGQFVARMEAKDGSFAFDFGGTYTEVVPEAKLAYTMADGRKVRVTFAAAKGGTLVTEEFEPESTHTHEMQQAGWQSILQNFKTYAESSPAELLRFSMRISAPAQKVYQRLLAADTYREWTKAFNPTSSFVGSWDKNATIRFVGTDGNGKQGGMISRIRENIPARFVSIEHLGIIQDGKEILKGPEVDSWAGALENYTLREQGHATTIEVCIDSNDAFKAYFLETWPKALALLKTVCERS